MEQAQKEELELAKKAMELEAEMEANMTVEERRQLQREREEADAKAMANDLFGGVDDVQGGGGVGGGGNVMQSGDKVVMVDLKDHLRHAKKIGECVQVSSVVDLFVQSLMCVYHVGTCVVETVNNYSHHKPNQQQQNNNRATVKSIYAQHSSKKSFNNAKMS